jgi:hypothetical protein
MYVVDLENTFEFCHAFRCLILAIEKPESSDYFIIHPLKTFNVSIA